MACGRGANLSLVTLDRELLEAYEEAHFAPVAEPLPRFASGKVGAGFDFIGLRGRHCSPRGCRGAGRRKALAGASPRRP